MKNNEEKHNKLVELIRVNGKAFPKKHGNWIVLKLNNEWFLQMDSWNKYIHLKEGDAEYSYWSGFNGKEWLFLGGNFGGFCDTFASIEAMISRVENWININKND